MIFLYIPADRLMFGFLAVSSSFFHPGDMNPERRIGIAKFTSQLQQRPL